MALAVALLLSMIAVCRAQSDPAAPDATAPETTYCEQAFAQCASQCVPKLPQIQCRRNAVLEPCACVSGAAAAGLQVCDSTCPLLDAHLPPSFTVSACCAMQGVLLAAGAALALLAAL
jgi:hypothetical protein